MSILNLASKILKHNQALLLVGPPGFAKTSFGKELAKKFNLNFKLVSFNAMQPEDWGYPTGLHADEIPRYTAPMWWPEKGNTLLCFDDVAQASPAMMSLLSEVILERTVHGRELPTNTRIMLTANRASDRAAATRIPTHIQSRCTALNVMPDVNEYVGWAMEQGYHTLGLSWLKAKGNDVFKFDPNADRHLNYRTYTSVNPHLIDFIEGSTALEDALKIISGLIPEEAAIDLLSWSQLQSQIPTIDEVISDPMAAKLPTDPQGMLAITHILGLETKDDNITPILKYVDRIKEEELHVMFFKYIPAKLLLHKEVDKWIGKHGSLFS